MDVTGLSEWYCYYADYDDPFPDDAAAAIDDCIDAHLAAGINRIAWNCGRGTVDYHSALPGTTQICELSDLIGGRSWSFVAAAMAKICPLRRAIAYGRERNVPIIGRLGMNRYYCHEKYLGVSSRFAIDNKQFHERSKLGNPRSGQMCYALPEVQKERLDILLEIQRIGVDGLLLDFCRQMPVLCYHDALVEPFMHTSGADPREIDSTDPEDYRDWFQYRADVLTGFMRRVRSEVKRQEQEIGMPCPIIARVPDSAPWLTTAYGLDEEQWFREDLVDSIMLCPFPRCRDDLELYPEHHIALAHKYGKACIGGIGLLGFIPKGANRPRVNTGFFHPKPVYELAHRQYQAGADGMSLYQTETLARMAYLEDTLKAIGDPGLVAERVRDLPDPDLPEDHHIGLDWHSRFDNGESLSVALAGDMAL